MAENSENSTQYFWTPVEVADLLRVTPRTVTEWLQAGKLKGNQLANKRWIVPSLAVREFIEAGSNSPVVAAAPLPAAPGPVAPLPAAISLSPSRLPSDLRSKAASLGVLTKLEAAHQRSQEVPTVPSSPSSLANRKNKFRK